MFCNFFPSANKEEMNGIEKAYEGINKPISPAQFQGFMLRCREGPTKALENMTILRELDPVDQTTNISYIS